MSLRFKLQLEKPCPYSRVIKEFACFPLVCVYALGFFTFKYLFHLEFVLVDGERYGSYFVFSRWLPKSPSTIYCKIHLFTDLR